MKTLFFLFSFSSFALTPCGFRGTADERILDCQNKNQFSSREKKFSVITIDHQERKYWFDHQSQFTWSPITVLKNQKDGKRPFNFCRVNPSNPNKDFPFELPTRRELKKLMKNGFKEIVNFKDKDSLWVRRVDDDKLGSQLFFPSSLRSKAPSPEPLGKRLTLCRAKNLGKKHNQYHLRIQLPLRNNK